MTKKILLVTGANGLLGSNLCLAAAQRGYEVRAMMRAPQRCAAFTAAGISLLRGDVTDLESIRAAARGAPPQRVGCHRTSLDINWGAAKRLDVPARHKGRACTIR
jgi:dihydroflavonol-4-reductase